MVDHARLPLLLESALDAIARHRAAGEPLDRVAAATARARHLGPRERSALGDLVFAWARHRVAAERLIGAALKERGGRAPALRERDLCALLLAQGATGANPTVSPSTLRGRGHLDDALAALVDEASVTGIGAALPPWLEARIRAERDDAQALIDALGRPAPIGLAVESTRQSVDAVVAAIAELGGRAAASPIVRGAVRVEGRLRLARLPKPVADAVWPMDEGSQVIARSLDARAGELVLDLCAGAGTKTRLLLASRARVVAADVGAARLQRAPAQAARVVMDGARAALRAASFDKVLVDAPCSGTGTLRRAPDLAHRLREHDLPQLVDAQRALLAQALTLVRPGGLVVYATCSLLRDENEAVVDHVLARCAGARRTSLAALWGDAVHLDAGHLDAGHLDAGHLDGVHLDDVGRGEMRLAPHLHGTDGFYIAALRAP